MGVRSEQKEKTRRTIIEAAFSQLTAERGFSSLSLREVAREAGLAATSFYRHFRDMDELGLTLVDEGGLTLRQLMRQARLRIASRGGSVIRTSVHTFMEFIERNPNVFRLLLRERSGTSAAFRQAVLREIRHFIAELADEMQKKSGCPLREAELQADAMVTLVFSAGADALDMGAEERALLADRLILQLQMIARGAELTHRSRESSAPART